VQSLLNAIRGGQQHDAVARLAGRELYLDVIRELCQCVYEEIRSFGDRSFIWNDEYPGDTGPNVRLGHDQGTKAALCATFDPHGVDLKPSEVMLLMITSPARTHDERIATLVSAGGDATV